MGTHGERFRDFVEQPVEAECGLLETEPPTLNFGKVENIIDQLKQRITVVLHDAEEFPLLRIQFGLGQ